MTKKMKQIQASCSKTSNCTILQEQNRCKNWPPSKMLIFVAGQTGKKHPSLWLTHSVWWHWPNDITLVKMTLLVKMTSICSKWHQFAQNGTTLVKMALLLSKWHHFCQNGITLAKITSFWSSDLTFWHKSIILFAINAFILWSVRKWLPQTI